MGKQLHPSIPPGYLDTLISVGDIGRRHARMVAMETGAVQQVLILASLQEIDHRNIFRGIANLEQGKTPRINQSVYFVNRTRDQVFYMYDDCGCIIYAASPATLQPLYDQRNSWLVDYYRRQFDLLFGAG